MFEDLIFDSGNWKVKLEFNAVYTRELCFGKYWIICAREKKLEEAAEKLLSNIGGRPLVIYFKNATLSVRDHHIIHYFGGPTIEIKRNTAIIFHPKIRKENNSTRVKHYTRKYRLSIVENLQKITNKHSYERNHVLYMYRDLRTYIIHYEGISMLTVTAHKEHIKITTHVSRKYAAATLVKHEYIIKTNKYAFAAALEGALVSNMIHVNNKYYNWDILDVAAACDNFISRMLAAATNHHREFDFRDHPVPREFPVPNLKGADI